MPGRKSFKNVGPMTGKMGPSTKYKEAAMGRAKAARKARPTRQALPKPKRGAKPKRMY